MAEAPQKFVTFGSYKEVCGGEELIINSFASCTRHSTTSAPNSRIIDKKFILQAIKCLQMTHLGLNLIWCILIYIMKNEFL